MIHQSLVKYLLSIKPKNGDFVSDFDKQNIQSKLKNYALSGINQKIIDLKVLYVEIDSAIYYNSSQVSNVNGVKSKVVDVLNTFSTSNINKFGGRFKYSKLGQIIDGSDSSITSNITRVIIRRNMKCLLNQSAQYELCYGNTFKKNAGGFNIKSTGFTLAINQVLCTLQMYQMRLVIWVFYLWLENHQKVMNLLL